MNISDDTRELLAPHGRRPIRAFLADPKVRDGELEAAFWSVIYPPGSETLYTRAVEIANELEDCPKTIDALLGGWRPKAVEEASHEV